MEDGATEAVDMTCNAMKRYLHKHGLRSRKSGRTVGEISFVSFVDSGAVAVTQHRSSYIPPRFTYAVLLVLATEHNPVSPFRRYLRHGSISDARPLSGSGKETINATYPKSPNLHANKQHVWTRDKFKRSSRWGCTADATSTTATQDPLCRTLPYRHLLLFPPPRSRIGTKDPASRVAAQTAARAGIRGEACWKWTRRWGTLAWRVGRSRAWAVEGEAEGYQARV